MAKIYIQGIKDGENTIDEIVWTDRYGNEEGIKLDAPFERVEFCQCDSLKAWIFREDLLSLQKAVNKAIDLGWHEV